MSFPLYSYSKQLEHNRDKHPLSPEYCENYSPGRKIVMNHPKKAAADMDDSYNIVNDTQSAMGFSSIRAYSVPGQDINAEYFHQNPENSYRNVTNPTVPFDVSLPFDHAPKAKHEPDENTEHPVDHPSLQSNSSNFMRSRSMKKKNKVACAVRRTDKKRDGNRPLEETLIYQSLDVTQFPSNLPRRRPRRRAVLVGVSYVLTPDLILRGTCNDAAAMGLILINLCEFRPEDIILLIDSFPAACYRHEQQREGIRSGDFVPWKNRQPSRQNILLALNWLKADTLPGDVLLFYFAGHGIQLDDLAGWEGEGYDEAILPMDFYGDEINAITAIMIKNVLLNVTNDVQVTIILDCNGGQTMLDPSGTGKWNFIKGVKQRGVWPFVTDATDKVSRAVYDQTPWMDTTMKRRGARPRFVPGAEVSSTQELLDPTLQKPSAQIASKAKGYLFSAAPWSQSAIEAKMSALRFIPIDRNNNIIQKDKNEKHHAYHGVFTWCFITTLQQLLIQAVNKKESKAVSYASLICDIERRITACKSPQGGLPKLDQFPELTFYRAGGSDGRDLFLWPFGGRRKGVGYADASCISDFSLPYFPHEQQYLSIWEAEEQLRQFGEHRRRNDPAFCLQNNVLRSSPAYSLRQTAVDQRLVSAEQSASRTFAISKRNNEQPRLISSKSQTLESNYLPLEKDKSFAAEVESWGNIKQQIDGAVAQSEQNFSTACPIKYTPNNTNKVISQTEEASLGYNNKKYTPNSEIISSPLADTRKNTIPSSTFPAQTNAAQLSKVHGYPNSKINYMNKGIDLDYTVESQNSMTTTTVSDNFSQVSKINIGTTSGEHGELEACTRNSNPHWSYLSGSPVAPVLLSNPVITQRESSHIPERQTFAMLSSPVVNNNTLQTKAREYNSKDYSEKNLRILNSKTYTPSVVYEGLEIKKTVALMNH